MLSLLTAGLLLAGAADAETTAAPTGATRAPPSIAVMAPLSGDRTDRGREVVAGVELAVADLGSDRDRPTVTVRDDACDAETAERQAHSIRALRPDLIIAPVCDGAALAAARVLAPAGVPVISPGARHPRLTSGRASRAILRLAGRDDRQGREAGQRLAQNAGGARIALVHDRTRFGATFVDDARERLQAAGVREVLRETIVAGDVQYDALVARLSIAGVDVVLFGGFPAEAAVLVRALRASGSRTRLFGPDTLADPSFAAMTGAALEGVRLSLPVATPNSGAGALLARRLAERANVAEGRASGDGLRAYAAVQVWWQARSRRQVGSSEMLEDGILAVLAEASFDTVLGSVRFDAAGDASLASYEPAEWRGGVLVRNPTGETRSR